MKILELLINEDFDFEVGGEGKGFVANNISVSDLNSLQLRTLKRLQDGVVDIESASDKELDLIMELIELGLVDDDGKLTDSGLEAIETPANTDSEYRTSEVPDDLADLSNPDDVNSDIDFKA